MSEKMIIISDIDGCQDKTKVQYLTNWFVNLNSSHHYTNLWKGNKITKIN